MPYRKDVPIYQMYKEKDGTYQLKVVGHTDVSAAINSHADEVDMHILLKKAEATGDYSKIKGNAGFYADTTGYPRSWNEAQKLASSLPKKLADIDPSVKAAFSSYSDFVSSVMEGSVYTKVAEFNEKNASKEHVKEGTAE